MGERGRQGRARSQAKEREREEIQDGNVAAVDNDNKELFAFTCMSNYANIAKALQVPKSRLGTCIDSGASRVYSPDSSKFTNYKLIDRSITMADG